MEPSGHQTTPIGSGTAPLTVANGFFELLDYDGPPDIPPDAMGGNGLVALGSTGANILTGIMFGPVNVTVEIHSDEPPVNTHGWDEVVETSQVTSSGIVSVGVVITGDSPTDLPNLQLQPDSWFRVRVHARGREAGRTMVTPPPHPVEDYLLQLWPSEPGAEVLHQQADRS